ncbi:MAG: SusD/RagB family nutrient-binding outer membrane lipoprotein, partial [Bacteroidaceae bacterium]|nr:SusD/RagB family nutrient-binding outer membrane lipoprotein [Bacteroidaceae bacterium]
MKKYIMIAGTLLFSTFALQSCLDYDDPGDELGLGSIKLETEVHHGTIDKIDYHTHPTLEQVKEAAEGLKNELAMTKTAYYCMRGGKNGEVPGAHAYQYQFTFGPDCYAQYHVNPHWDYAFGTGGLTSTYDLSLGYNGGPLGAYTMAKNAVMSFLHHPLSDYVPEVKAINLLFYCIAAQEQADYSGPFTYLEDKENSETPAIYNDLQTIYYGIVDNIDTIVACLKNFENREQWYKDQILGRNFLRKYNAASLL